ncbi:MAG: CHAT domain-containing protein [Phycisphaerae bacterium]|nr:CHAT domain-containing protein [Saprospiraceae bacterium]
MKGICHFLLTTLLHLLLLLPLFAQNADKSLEEMSWKELSEKWEALAVLGKNEEALPYARSALEMARRDSTEASLSYGVSLDNLGYSLHHSRQYAEAEKCFTAAVGHARLHLGEDHEDYITRLSNLAMLHMDMVELAKSASELESAVHLADKNLTADNPFVPIMVNNLGLAYERLGDLDRALKHYLRALDLTERTVGKDNARYGIRLFNIAAIYRKTGKFEQALDFNLRAHAIFEKTVVKTHPGYALGLNGLMASYIELSRFEEAFPLSEELLSLAEARAGNPTTEMFDYLAVILNLYYSAGQYSRAVDFGKQIRSKYQEIFPRPYSRQAYIATRIMSSLEKLGRLEEAAEFARLQNRLTLDELMENSRQFSEAEHLKYYQTYTQIADAYSLQFALQHPEFQEMAGAAFDYQLALKGLSLANRRELFHSLRENPQDQLSTQFEAWQRLQNDISKQYALPPARRQRNLDSLLDLSNELERNLVRGSEPFRLATQNFRWQDVQSALLPGEAAIEFGRVKDPRSDSILYAAWMVRPGDKAPRQIILFEEKEISNLAATRHLYAPDHLPVGKNLHELLWKPLEPLLKDISTIYFAPASVLHQINFGAVPISPSEVLADRFKVHRLVSTRQILTLKNKPEQALPRSALVFGGIKYETDSVALSVTNTVSVEAEKALILPNRTRGLSFGDDWEFLSGTLKEAVEVRNRLEKVGAKVAFADGFHASEGFFKKTAQASPSPAVLHLATHGFFLTAPDTNAHSGFATAENPMARAGLVLSGANRAWSGGEPLAGQEDGILTALEISRLDLSGTELAVLSACGTGQGKVEAGEGVLGLQRAFKMAGVHYVIMTLWNVQDHDAQQFMDLFYDQWLSQKKSVPDAFRVAQQKMRALHSKPFQPMAWAGFLLLE